MDNNQIQFSQKLSELLILSSRKNKVLDYKEIGDAFKTVTLST